MPEKQPSIVEKQAPSEEVSQFMNNLAESKKYLYDNGVITSFINESILKPDPKPINFSKDSLQDILANIGDSPTPEKVKEIPLMDPVSITSPTAEKEVEEVHKTPEPSERTIEMFRAVATEYIFEMIKMTKEATTMISLDASEPIFEIEKERFMEG